MVDPGYFGLAPFEPWAVGHNRFAVTGPEAKIQGYREAVSSSSPGLAPLWGLPWGKRAVRPYHEVVASSGPHTG